MLRNKTLEPTSALKCHYSQHTTQSISNWVLKVFGQVWGLQKPKIKQFGKGRAAAVSKDVVSTSCGPLSRYLGQLFTMQITQAKRNSVIEQFIDQPLHLSVNSYLTYQLRDPNYQTPTCLTLSMLATERKHAILAVPERVHFPPSSAYCKISLLYIYLHSRNTTFCYEHIRC